MISLQNVRGEVRAGDEVDRLVLARLIVRLIISLHTIIDALGSFFGMQLTRVAILIHTVVVIDTVRGVGCLLNLAYLTAGTDSMDASGRNEEAVSVLYRVLRQGIDNSLIRNHLLVFVRRELLLESAVQTCIVGRGEHVPHLSLAERQAVLLRKGIGRMNLDAQVVARVDELHQ